MTPPPRANTRWTWRGPNSGDPRARRPSLHVTDSIGDGVSALPDESLPGRYHPCQCGHPAAVGTRPAWPVLALAARAARYTGGAAASPSVTSGLLPLRSCRSRAAGGWRTRTHDAADLIGGAELEAPGGPLARRHSKVSILRHAEIGSSITASPGTGRSRRRRRRGSPRRHR